jgi:very-short-patch-repair endonuclease
MSKSKKFDFKEIKKHAGELRRQMTDSEKILWKEVRDRRISGYKFLRQHPIIYKGDLTRLNYFIADFYCDEKKAIIELDGPVHDSSKEYDQFRDEELSNLSIHILRIKNDELLNMKVTKQRIKTFLDSIL